MLHNFRIYYINGNIVSEGHNLQNCCCEMKLEMANQKLEYALIIHNVAVEEIQKLEKVYSAAMDMKKKWDAAHREYIESVSEIKRMLAM